MTSSLSLVALLPEAAIGIGVRIADWREALRETGALLAASGAVTGAYTGEMIEAVERHGPYVVIAPGLALAHARPSPSVRALGLSWLRPAEPVEFGSRANDPVRLVVGLAATDHRRHTEALAALATLLADPATRAALEHAPDATALRDLLRRHERPTDQGVRR